MVKLYVEGGGDSQLLKSACRQGFSEFLGKAAYGKGDHFFKLLALIDPAKVFRASPWAQRFIETLQVRMGQA